MLFRQKFNTFIRIYNNIGYIVNKDNYSDRVLDKSGSIFLKSLSRKPKKLEEIISEIDNCFIDADREIIVKDTIEFLNMLEQDGFIVSGKTIKELDNKDKHFSYDNLNIKDNSHLMTTRSKEKTQDFFNEYFKENPCLTQLQIEISNKCNERCIHCYIPHRNKLYNIDFHLFNEIIKQCEKMNVLNISLTGGEPMMHPKFLKFLELINDYDFSVSILSNLTLLDKKIIDHLKKIRLSGIQVSLYSMDHKIHDSITGVPGSFFKTYNSILKLIENNISVQISCPVMKQNRNCYIDVMNWSHDHKCKIVTDFIMMARNDNSEDNLINRLSIEETDEIIKKILNNDIEYQKEIMGIDFNEKKKYNRENNIICGVCISSICMDPLGNIYPCSGWQSYIVGNIYQNSLKDIWEKSSKVNYLRNLRIRDFPKCVNCHDYLFCEICMVRNANENDEKNPLIVNEHFCEIASLNHNIAIEWRSKNAPSN
jgi:radical SAM protein with 4Fe4S-binding SPASM domain